MVTSILVAVDASPRAPGVLKAAAELAARFEAKLLPLRVVTIPPEFPAAARTLEDPVPEKLRALASAELSAQLVAAGLHDSPPTVREGQPWRAILEAAKELDVDLIVLGSHGYDGWDRILGTTAAKVVNLADRNVLVVHERPPSH